jgi:flagellar biosynthesis/type III secretory pathway protein FliH
MDADALPAPLQQPLVVRALEELKMLTQTDLERERYEARRKAQLDENTLVRFAQMQLEKGREEGREEGRKKEIIATIHFCERLLNRPESPATVGAMNLDELVRLAEELRVQVLQQRQAP